MTGRRLPTAILKEALENIRPLSHNPRNAFVIATAALTVVPSRTSAGAPCNHCGKGSDSKQAALGGV
jgi:hypothetical protein